MDDTVDVITPEAYANTGHVEEPVIAGTGTDADVVILDMESTSDEQAPVAEPDATNTDWSKPRIPQPPAEVSFVDGTDADQSEFLDANQPPVEDLDLSMPLDTTLIAPEPPTPFQQMDVDEESLILQGVTIPDATIESALLETDNDEKPVSVQGAAVENVGNRVGDRMGPVAGSRVENVPRKYPDP